MNKINLLPDNYCAAQATTRRQRRYILWGVVLLAVGVAWWQAATHQAQRVLALADEFAGQVEVERDQSRALKQQEARQRALEAVLALRDDLEAPIQTTTVVAALSKALPRNVALTRLSVEMTPTPASAGSVAPLSGARRASPARPAAEKNPMRIELEGIAGNEADVARCVSALAEHQLFANVKLVKSREMPDGGLARFGFLITVDVPLNRRYMGKETTANAT